jgi:hypothetical protein
METRASAFNSPHPEQANLLLRAGALTGMTPAMLMVRDLGLQVKFLRGLPEFAGQQIFLYGHGEAGAAALYHAVLDPNMAGVVAERIPPSHRDGAYILGILRVMDMEQAVGLVLPRPVGIVAPPPRRFFWARRLACRLKCEDRLFMGEELAPVLKQCL